MSFARDNRLSIVVPGDNASVGLPFTLTWKAPELTDRFVIFFDRAPMRPNTDLLSVVAQTDPCRTRPKCPDDLWLSQNNVYVTDHTSLVVNTLPDTRQNGSSLDEHEVTIVLMDRTTGRRIGQEAWVRDFSVNRGTK